MSSKAVSGSYIPILIRCLELSYYISPQWKRTVAQRRVSIGTTAELTEKYTDYFTDMSQSNTNSAATTFQIALYTLHS